MTDHASVDVPPLSERKAWRMVACARCHEPLYFPSTRTGRQRTPFLFCRKCGARTPIPTWHRLFFQVVGVLIFIAACAFVILTLIKEA